MDADVVEVRRPFDPANNTGARLAVTLKTGFREHSGIRKKKRGRGTA
ncbi:hypothetical protein [Paraburkholderia sp. BL10I2N1]|nr:hypothetical protein [Paraburkholderia sp. BL10I2N1]